MTATYQQSSLLRDRSFRNGRVTSVRFAPGMPHKLQRRCPARLCIAAQAQQKPLVVVGSINADMVLEVDRIPAEGETLAAKALTTHPGGKVSIYL